jgi:hypothetical protein
MGWRGRGRGRYPGNGPFRNLPPWERPGWLYGYGRGRFYGTGDPTVCQRFPWLPRWWWARTDPTEDTPVWPPVEPTSEMEKQFLEERARALEANIELIKKRLGELEESETED